MQDKPIRKTQSVDGFIGGRQRRAVSLSPNRPLARAPQPTPRQILGRAAAPVSVKQAPKIPAEKLIARATPPASTSPILSRSKRSRRDRRRAAKANAAPKPRWRVITKRVSLVILALFLVSGGWMGWKVYSNTSKIFGNKNPLAVLSAFKPVPLKGQSTGHVNILLAGDSADRTDSAGGGDLTDSIMIVSVNTTTHAAYMLSIPRDLWVNIPGIGYSKINAANTVTDFSQSGYPNGGIGMLEKVISDNFGININYYALVNYTAFRDAVNQAGGIDVNIQSPDPRGIYDPSFRANEGGPLKLPNGMDHLTGQVALNLARARGDPYNGVYGAYGFPQSDFDRTTHQRQMMLALKEKAVSLSVLSNPIKIGGMMDAVGNNVKTDFQINELASAYYLMKGIKSSDIQSMGLNSANGVNLLANYTSANGQSALIPAAGVDDFSDIQAYINKMFNATAVTKEAANVVVLNGGNIAGLAKTYGDLVTQKGAVVTSVGDAPASRPKTTIIDNSGGKKPATKAALASMFGNNFGTDATLTQQYPGDFIVVLGVNQQAPGTSATSTTPSTASSTSAD